MSSTAVDLTETPVEEEFVTPAPLHDPTHRRTLSGKLVPIGFHLPTWHELVRAPAKTTPRAARTGDYYLAMQDVPEFEPEPLVIVRASTRHPGRPNNAYSKSLRSHLGEAWTRHHSKTTARA